MENSLGATGTLLRETKGEVVLASRLRAALERLNPSRIGHHALQPEAITAAVDELPRDRSGMIPGLRFYLTRSFYCSVKHWL